MLFLLGQMGFPAGEAMEQPRQQEQGGEDQAQRVVFDEATHRNLTFWQQRCPLWQRSSVTLRLHANWWLRMSPRCQLGALALRAAIGEGQQLKRRLGAARERQPVHE